MVHHDSDLYKSNILLLDKSPFIVTKIYANIIFFLKTILLMNFTYYFIKNDFKSYHTSLHSFQFIQEFATKALIIETTSNNIITTDYHYYFLSFFNGHTL